MTETLEYRTYDYYRTRKDANEDAKYLRSRGIKCRIENSTGTRARRTTYDKPWKILFIERDTNG